MRIIEPSAEETTLPVEEPKETPKKVEKVDECPLKDELFKISRMLYDLGNKVNELATKL